MSEEKRPHNMGFSAMLAEEYILMVPFAYQQRSGSSKKSEQQNITSTVLTLLIFGSG